MIMNNALLMAQKFRAAEEQVSEERGGFCLFGLFERQQTPGRWDLVAAAPWLKTDRDGTLELIVLLRDKMETQDWDMIASVFPIEPSAEYVNVITSIYSLDHGLKEVSDPDYKGPHNVYIGHAFLITSNASPAPASAAKELAAA